MTTPLQSLLDFAKDLTSDAGELALSQVGRTRVHFKEDRSIVTDADLAVQAYIKGRIASTYPEHGFVGEEAGAQQRAEGCSEVWIVDPIDGTDTFRRGLPAWAVSVGLLSGDKPVLGVTAIPATGELYWALSGERAYLDAQPICVTPGDGLGRGTLTLVPSNLHQVARATASGRIQGYGSNCFHLACVAKGAAQAAVLGASSVWDYFAASVILEAAGGALFDIQGKRLDIGALAVSRTTLIGAIACHPDRLAAVLDSFDVDLPRDLHAFSGRSAPGAF